MPATIRPATQADSSVQSVAPQGPAGSGSEIGSFQDSVLAAISAGKQQDGSKSQGGKATRERNGDANGSQNSDSQSGSAQNGLQGILYIPSMYSPAIQTPEVQSASAQVPGTGVQDGTDSGVVTVSAQNDPLSFSGQSFASSAQILNGALRSASTSVVSNSALLPGNTFTELLPSNTLKGTLATGLGRGEAQAEIPSTVLFAPSSRAVSSESSKAVSSEASSPVNSAASVPTSSDHSQVNAVSSPALHENRQTQPVEASNQVETGSAKTSDNPGAATNTTPSDSAALAALAQLAPQTTQVPNIAPQAITDMLAQSSRQGSQSKVAGVEAASSKSVDQSNSEISGVTTKSSVQDKDGKASESQQNQPHGGSQDGTNTNPDQSSSQFAVNLKDHATSFQNVAGASANSSQSAQLQSAPTDQLHSTKAGVSPEALASNPGQGHMDGSNTGVSTQPIVNTARLMQSINGSELKLGMQSDEFGKISITTSATRDTILAQIYVDHSDLAKTLTSNLPEIQSRVGGGQSFDIRVATTGGASGMSSNTSTGDMNQQANQQQRSNQSFTKGIAPVNSSTSTGSTLVVPEAQHASLIDNRLDLRV